IFKNFEHPFNLEWIIAEDRLKALKDTTKNEYLESGKFAVAHSSGVNYYLAVSLNGDTGARRGFLKIEHESKWKRKLLKPKRTTTRSLRDLWNAGFKDFTIVVGRKEIEVHKNVLACQSPVFEAMFKPHTIEAKESKVEISDYTFEIIEKGIKLCYKQILVSDCSVEESLLLLKFTDKYDIKVVKENLEEYLGDQVTVENVCEISKCSGETNALKLGKKCLDFLVLLLAKKELVPNMEILESSFLISAIKNSSCRKCQTL
uniref:BTB domain-containing protein n=1 Tax=Panagrolaimus sp. PS1159 TaxID=55785 RepID=A0AC35GIJ9_9BILA